MVEESIIGRGEAKVLLTIVKFPENDHTATNISKSTGLSIMGVFKILKGLERKGILSAKKIGRVSLYKIENKSRKASALIVFLLRREAEQQSAYVRSLLQELRKIEHADIIILFGSVLKKEKDAQDIDAVIVTTPKNFNTAKKEIERINIVNAKKVHPVYQTINDLKKNVQKNDPIILQAMQGIVIVGEEKLIEVLTE